MSEEREKSYDPHAEIRRFLNSDVPVARFMRSEELRNERVSFNGWPFCFRCMRPVRAYGWVDRDHPKYVRIWARCHGQEVQTPPILKPSRSPGEGWFKATLASQIFFR